MSVNENILRHGNFTSSEIVALTTKGKAKDTFGKPALTYIRKKKNERRLGKSIKTESNAKPLVWGKFLERLVFDLMGFDYSLCSQETIQHPTIPYWTGTPDATKKDTVCDIKCPFTLDSFCELVNPLYEGLKGMDAMNYIRENHNDGEKYYYQLVSNAILTNSKYAELIVYVPYESEIQVIRKEADGNPNAHFINWAMDNELPSLKEGGYYTNINSIRFEVPKEDKDFLTECVLKAGKLLIEPNPSILLAHHDSEVGATIVENEFNPSLLKKISQ